MKIFKNVNYWFYGKDKIGTDYGGWVLPKHLNLNSESIIYSGGVGEDISFDLAISSRYKAQIFLIDPTQRAIIHFNEIKKFYRDKKESVFSRELPRSYLEFIALLNPVLDKFKFLEVGLWSEAKELKFYKQKNPEWVSQSLIEGMQSEEFDIVPCESLATLIKQHSSGHADLIKIDIEGAENEVLNDLIKQNILPQYLCVEFDLKRRGLDVKGETSKLISELSQLDYDIFDFDKNEWNITFVRKA